MEEVECAVRKTKEGYGKPRSGYEEFLKTCKLFAPFLPETSFPSLCKGYELPSGLRLHDIMIQPYYDARTLQARPTDILVASYPKTGHTWTKEFCYLIINNADLSMANEKLAENRIPFIEIPMMGIQGVETLPNPRIIHSHLPYEELPTSYREQNTKIVYVYRNPKDTIVSNYHFVQMLGYFAYTGSFESYLDLFLAGNVMYSSYAKHVLSYWNQRNSGKVCFLVYEQLQRDLHAGIRKVAKFLGNALTEEQVDQIAGHCSFENMSKNPVTNYTGSGTVIFNPNINFGFMRKGEVGDWRNLFTDETNKKVDDYISKHFHGSGLEFEYDLHA